jgi:two-component system CheB/CheR fusion protein
MFGISTRDIGKPFHDLKVSYHPVELRLSIERVLQNHKSEIIQDVEWHSNSNDTQFLEVQVVPLTARDDKALLGASILFTDVTEHKKLQEELETTNQEFETAMEEYQSTNEELETTNEELQSTIEELETTNEELQSTNEELETMNEELQSTNQEMEVMNKELNQRNRAYNRVNAFLESILSSLSSGVIVLDSELKVLIWNKAAEDLWGLRGEEVQNQYFLGLDIGLPVEKLKRPIRSCLAEEQSQDRVVLKARNRRGKEIQCRVTCTNLQDFNQDIDGVILLMEEIEKEQMAEG